MSGCRTNDSTAKTQRVHSRTDFVSSSGACLVETALTAEHKFYVLLWQKRYQEALLYAGDMAELLPKMQLSPSRWVEREGDASFYGGDYPAALLSYRQSLEGRKKPNPIFLKLSDVHFKLGNFEQERNYREKIYGRLDAQ